MGAKIYAAPGSNVQHIRKQLEGTVLMGEGAAGLRPEDGRHYVCQDNGGGTGIWVVDAAATQEAQRNADIEATQSGGGLRGITPTQAKAIIHNRYQAVRDLVVLGGSNAETISNISAKFDALIDACESIDKKEAMYILK